MAAVPPTQPPSAGGASFKSPELSRVDGVLWKCIGRESVEGGFRYTFRVPEILKGSSEEEWIAVKEFPAVELTFQGVSELIPPRDKENFEALGISFNPETGTLILPDKGAFDAAWERFCRENPGLELPDISVCESEGIASPRDFTVATTEHDWLLSNAGEFVHDWLLHGIPTLKTILSNRAYPEIRQAYRRITRSALGRLDREMPDIRQRFFAFTMGVFADEMSASGYEMKSSERFPAEKAITNSLRNAMEEAREEAWYRHFAKEVGKDHAFHAEKENHVAMNATWNKFLDSQS